MVGNKTDLEDKRKVPFEEAVRLGKKLNLAAVFEASAKSNSSIDDAFFRSIANCVDFYNVDGGEPLVSKGGARSRKFSAQTELVKRGERSFRANTQEEMKELEEYDNYRYSEPGMASNKRDKVELYPKGEKIMASN